MWGHLRGLPLHTTRPGRADRQRHHRRLLWRVRHRPSNAAANRQGPTPRVSARSGVIHPLLQHTGHAAALLRLHGQCAADQGRHTEWHHLQQLHANVRHHSQLQHVGRGLHSGGLWHCQSAR